MRSRDTMRKAFDLLLALTLVLSLGLATGVPAWADDTGAKYPGTGGTSAEAPYDDVDWTDPGNAMADDGSYATAVIPRKGYTCVLRLIDFDFSIPAGVTIDGVKVEVRRCANVGNNLRDGLVQLTKDGTNGVGSNKAVSGINWPSSPANQEYGGGTDLWETSWTAAEINSAAFGVLFSAYNNHGAHSRTAYVDYIRVTVYYTPLPVYDLNMAASPDAGGRATDLINGSPYKGGAKARIRAEASAGYRFVNWTATGGEFDDENAEETAFTMPSQNATITANFEAVTYNISGTVLAGTGGLEYVSVAATGGHSQTVYTHGDGKYELTGVAHGATNIVITPALVGYIFTPTDLTVTGPVEADVEGQDLAAAATVDIAAIPGVTVPATGETPVAVITETDQYTGTVSWSPADDPFAGEVAYTATITLVAKAGYTFTGVGEDFFTVAGAVATNDADSGVVEAVFPATEAATAVTTQAASAVGTDSATLNMSYTVGNYSAVDVRFVYKKSVDTASSYTAWVSKTGDGVHSETVAELARETTYEFKAQLRCNDTVIEDTILQFTTIAPSGSQPSTPSDSVPLPGPCFIATAAYGTPTDARIDVLREFRDRVLLQSSAGSRFVTWYYQTSPPIAEFIAGNELVRTLVSVLLVDPVVWLVESTGSMWRTP